MWVGLNWLIKDLMALIAQWVKEQKKEGRKREWQGASGGTPTGQPTGEEKARKEGFC